MATSTVPEPATQVPVSRRDPAGSGADSNDRGATADEGQVLVTCPNCSVQYRIAANLLDKKIECVDCHRRFLARATVGKRARRKDNTGVLVPLAIGLVLVLLVLGFMSLTDDKPKRDPAAETTTGHVSRVRNARAEKLQLWAQAVRRGYPAVLKMHTDLAAVASKLALGDPTQDDAVIAKLLAHDATLPLRMFDCTQAAMVSDDDVTARAGKAILYLAPKSGDPAYEADAKGEVLVHFRMQDSALLVTGLEVVMVPRKKGEAALPTPTPTPSKEPGK